ncbi:MAG: hypothetical protein MJ252_14740 [archaeon]|nr:hypothetical protein [archaeon]
MNPSRHFNYKKDSRPYKLKGNHIISAYDKRTCGHSNSQTNIPFNYKNKELNNIPINNTGKSSYSNIKKSIIPKEEYSNEIKNKNKKERSFTKKEYDMFELIFNYIGVELFYIQKFISNKIFVDDLFLLTKDDLREMEIPIGPRNRLIKFIKQFSYSQYFNDINYENLITFLKKYNYSQSAMTSLANSRTNSTVLSRTNSRGNTNHNYRNINEYDDEEPEEEVPDKMQDVMAINMYKKNIYDQNNYNKNQPYLSKDPFTRNTGHSHYNLSSGEIDKYNNYLNDNQGMEFLNEEDSSIRNSNKDVINTNRNSIENTMENYGKEIYATDSNYHSNYNNMDFGENAFKNSEDQSKDNYNNSSNGSIKNSSKKERRTRTLPNKNKTYSEYERKKNHSLIDIQKNLNLLDNIQKNDSSRKAYMFNDYKKYRKTQKYLANNPGVPITSRAFLNEVNHCPVNRKNNALQGKIHCLFRKSNILLKSQEIHKSMSDQAMTKINY